MKIVHIVPSLESRHGGPSISVPRVANALARMGHEVELLSTGAKEPAPAAIDGLTVRIFRREFPAWVCPSSELRRYLDDSIVDVVHSHGLWLRPLHYARRRTQRGDVRHVISPRGMMATWAWHHHRWRKQIVDRFVHPGALAETHGWHATSEAEAADIRSRGFRQPTCVAANGTSAPTPAEIAAATAYWQATCPRAADQPTALFYSRFHPKKRVMELIDLWIEHAPRGWLLLLVGIPETYSVSQLTEYAKRGGGSDRVRVFDGTDVPAPYVTASLFILPSHSENFGLVIAEALAHGVPALVTDTTPWGSLHSSGHGWCVAWRDFAPTLRAALSLGPEELRRIGESARRWVLAEYSWDGCARQLSDFYAEICARA